MHVLGYRACAGYETIAIVIHRLVRIHPLQGWQLVLVWSSKEGEWTPQPMNRYLQIALEILLVP